VIDMTIRHKKTLRCSKCQREHVVYVTGERIAAQTPQGSKPTHLKYPCECGEQIRYTNDLP
jgi:RNase P subunit RPR2